MEAEGEVKDDCSGRSPKIIVSFTPPKGFEFSCTKVTKHGSGKIEFRRKSGETWTFVSNDLPEPPFTWKLTEDASVMTVTDEYKTPGEDYNYSITVHDGRCDYTTDGRFTPPPMIMNR